MTVLPVVAREMSVLARRRSTYWSRAVTGLLALLVMLWLLIVSASRLSFSQLGSSMFLILSSLCFTFTVLVGMQATSDSLSEEKREGTLGLLFLTDLKGLHVIGGKMAASSLHSILALIGVIPMLSLALLLGGVTLPQFGLMALVLGNTMFFSLSLGVFVSSISKNERKAMMGTFAGLSMIVLAPFGIGMLFPPTVAFPEEILAVSPLYAFSSLHINPLLAAAKPQYFWISLVGTHLLSWFFLLLAAWILPRCINELPAARFKGVRNLIDNLVYGRRHLRKKHRAALLDRNAFLWLASRERVKSKYAWGVIGFFVALHIWVGLQFENMMFDMLVSAALMFLVHLVFKIWVASEVCSRLIQERRSGAFELLLSTPLSVQQIADGQAQALRRLFLKPIIFLLGLEALLFWGGSRAAGQVISSSDRTQIYALLISTFILDLWALKWVALWLSLKGKSIERVLITTLVRVLAIPWLVFGAVAGLIGGAVLVQQQELEPATVLNGFWFLSLGMSTWFGLLARKRFLERFRALASGRFEVAHEVEPQGMAVKRSGVPHAQYFRRHPVATALFGTLFLLILLGWARGEYWGRKVESQFASARQQGYPIRLNEMAAYYRSVPLDQNAFEFLRYNANVAWKPGLNYPGRKSQMGISATELERYRLFLVGNQAPLKTLWKLPTVNQGSFDPLALDLWGRQRQQISYAILLESDLAATTLAEEAPDRERIMRDILALLAQARLLRQQPLAFAQFTAKEALQRLTSGLVEVLRKDLLDEEALVRLQAELERLENPLILQRTLALQRALFIEHFQHGDALFRGRGPTPTTLLLIENLQKRIGSKDKGLNVALTAFTEALQVAELPIAKRLGAYVLDEESQRLWAGMPGFYGSIPEVIWNDVSFTAYVQLIRAALAAERYQRKHGRLPETLEMLVPEFLSAVPDDPCSGGPLRSIQQEGLLVYSVGIDQQDNTVTNQNKQAWADLLLPLF